MAVVIRDYFESDADIVASSSLSAPSDTQVVRAALKICRDTTRDVNSRKHAVEILYKNISITLDCFRENNNYVLYLRDIVLEGDIADANNQSLQLKHFAFSCLKSVATQLSNEFYNNFYSDLREKLEQNFRELENEENRRAEIELNGLILLDVDDEQAPGPRNAVNPRELAVKNLDQYIETCDETKKYRMLKTLSICLSEGGRINAAIFNAFPSQVWGKELLTSHLLAKNRTAHDVAGWNGTSLPALLREIDRLHDFLREHSTRYCIEDVLEILISPQHSGYLDVGFIAKVLSLLHNERALDVISRDFCDLLLVVDDLKVIQLAKLCDDNCISYTSEEEVNRLYGLILYEDGVTAETLSKVAPNTSISELVDFFTHMREINLVRPEDALRRLTPEKSMTNWKRELYFSRLETLICQQFSNYNYDAASTLPEDVKTEANKKRFSSVTQSMMETCLTYRQFNKNKKAQLNDELRSGDKKLVLLKHFHDLNNVLAKLALKFNGSDEILKQMSSFIKCLDSRSKIVQLTNALELLLDYDIDITQHKIFQIISDSTQINVQKNVHKYIIENSFTETYEKTVDQLIDELLDVNQGRNISLLQTREEIRRKYNEVMDSYNSESVLLRGEEPIKEWGPGHIVTWASRYKKAVKGTVSQAEKIAVIERAVEFANSITPRDIQILSVLLMLNSEDNKGRLAQVNTGEGKTTIIAMIAAYHGLDGKTVDVITSSRVLAQPQARQLKTFYNYLQLSVSHNCFDYSSQNSRAYACDIVYGTSSAFQGDILRDEFRQMGIRGDRQCDVAIVDEVDNMLVDGNNYIVLLACDMPGMDHLEPILGAIYSQVKAAAASIVEENGQLYFIQRENAFDENGQRRGDVVENHIPIDGTAEDFIKKCIEQHVSKLIRNCDANTLPENFPELKIPQHLRELVCSVKFKKWIQKAIEAKFSFEKDKNYIFDNKNQVKIVDAHNTGVVQPNMQWSDGLHQFLEIKHGTEVHPESLTTNYLSNVGFFRRYPTIHGLSGTLGGDGTRTLLHNTYDVDSVIVPPFKLKRYKQLPTVVVHNENEWYMKIAESCIQKLNNGRAVLIINEFIQQTEILEKIFVEQFGYDKEKIRLYKTNNESSVVEKVLGAGEIIITTNISGRGTDIKLTNSVENNGGLHVCISFVPKNARVGDQNEGRTSRMGNRGTSQFILYSSDGSGIETLLMQRSGREEVMLRSAKKEIERVTMEDEVFERFKRLLNNLTFRTEFVRDIEREAVEERFGIWKARNEDNTDQSRDRVFESFRQFREEVSRDATSGTLIKNVYFYVKAGNKYFKEEKYNEAISEYTLAIQLDAAFAEHAYCNRACAKIALYESQIFKDKPLIAQAVEDLKEARKLIEEREKGLHLMHQASDNEVFAQQLSRKLNLYNVQKNAIDHAIGPDQNVVEETIRELEETIKKFEEKKKSDETSLEDKNKISEDINKISEEIENLKSQRDNKGVIGNSMATGGSLKINVSDIKKSFPEDDRSHDKEIEEYERNGGIGAFTVSEVPPIPWRSVIGLMLLGFAQLVAGVAITVFSFGFAASFGIGMAMEGVSDIITAIREGIINRDFSWSRWALMKTASLAISVACAGLGAIQNVVELACTAVKSVGREVVTETVKTGWKMVAKRVGLELTKGIGKELVVGLTSYGVSKLIMPTIEAHFMSKIQQPIQEALEKNRFVKMMLELDQINNNEHYEKQIREMGLKLLHSPSIMSKIMSTVDILGPYLAKLDSNKVNLSLLLQGAAAVKATYEIITLTNNFIKELEKMINDQADKDKVEELLADVKRRQQIENSAAANPSVESPNVVNVNTINKEFQVKVKKANRDSKFVSQVFINSISTKLLHNVQERLISPVLRMGTNFSINAVTSSVTQSFNEAEETYRAHRRIIHHQNAGFNNEEVTKSEAQTKDPEMEHMIAKVDKLIKNTRSGEASGLLHLGAASDAIDRPIEVYNENGKLKYTIGDTKAGEPVQIQCHAPANGTAVGHYTLLGNEEVCFRQSGSNMCLYNVISAQSGHDPNYLKNSCIDIMESNKTHMAKQVNDITRLEMYSSVSLAMGGRDYKYEDSSNQNYEFVSNVEMAAVAYTAQKLYRERQSLNNNKVNGTKEEILQRSSTKILCLSKSELQISRPMYGKKWQSGKLISVQEINSVKVEIQNEQVRRVYPIFA